MYLLKPLQFNSYKSLRPVFCLDLFGCHLIQLASLPQYWRAYCFTLLTQPAHKKRQKYMLGSDNYTCFAELFTLSQSLGNCWLVWSGSSSGSKTWSLQVGHVPCCINHGLMHCEWNLWAQGKTERFSGDKFSWQITQGSSSSSSSTILAPSHVAEPWELRGLQVDLGDSGALGCDEEWLGETQLSFGTDFSWLWDFLGSINCEIL